MVKRMTNQGFVSHFCSGKPEYHFVANICRKYPIDIPIVGEMSIFLGEIPMI